MLIINARGTTRNINESQFKEYERKGYKKVEAKGKANKEQPKADAENIK